MKEIIKTCLSGFEPMPYVSEHTAIAEKTNSIELSADYIAIAQRRLF